jgi:DNA-binding PadR family transcriptional regulator
MWHRPWHADTGRRQRWDWRDLRDVWRDFGAEFEGGRGGGRGWRGGRERMERGRLRYLILDALRDGPKHGYEIIKRIEDRTNGWYAPSPGTVYPTLQMLEDLGLVRSETAEGRRVYHLTDAGRAELDDNSERVDEVWARFGGRQRRGPDLGELAFLRDEVIDLLRTTVQVAARDAFHRDDPETLREIRRALERCKNEIRDIGSRQSTPQQPPADAPGTAPTDRPGERFYRPCQSGVPTARFI